MPVLVLDYHPECCGVLEAFNYRGDRKQKLENLIKCLQEIFDQGLIRSSDKVDDSPSRYGHYFNGFFEAEACTGQYMITMNFTDEQLSMYDSKLAKALASIKGVRKGPRWENPNTGNYITHFTYSKPPKKPTPYKWKGK